MGSLQILQQLHNRQVWAEGKSHPNMAWRRNKNLAGYVDPGAAAQPAIYDESANCSTWTICTAAEDREGDVVIPNGCRLDHYAKNPVWFFEHQDEPLPIGVARTPSGLLTVQVLPDRVTAKCFHHDLTPMARDVRNLVAAGILSACSIGFLPVVSERRSKSAADKFGGVTPRYQFPDWWLLEISICGVGVNPEALRVELSANRIQTASLRRTLEPLAQQGKSWANGWTNEGIMKFKKANLAQVRFPKSAFSVDQAESWLSKVGLGGTLLDDGENLLLPVTEGIARTEEKSLAGGVKAMVKAMDDDEEDEDEIDLGDEDEGDEESMEDEEETKSEESEDDEIEAAEEETGEDLDGDNEEGESEEHQNAVEEAGVDAGAAGPTTLSDLVRHFRGMGEYLTAMSSKNEDPDVRALITKMQQTLPEIEQELSGKFSEKYPHLDLEGLLSATPPTGETGETEDEMDEPIVEKGRKKKAVTLPSADKLLKAIRSLRSETNGLAKAVSGGK